MTHSRVVCSSHFQANPPYKGKRKKKPYFRLHPAPLSKAYDEAFFASERLGKFEFSGGTRRKPTLKFVQQTLSSNKVTAFLCGVTRLLNGSDPLIEPLIPLWRTFLLRAVVYFSRIASFSCWSPALVRGSVWSPSPAGLVGNSRGIAGTPQTSSLIVSCRILLILSV